MWPDLVTYYKSINTGSSDEPERVRRTSVKGIQPYSLSIQYLKEGEEFKSEEVPAYELIVKQFIGAKDVPIKYIKQLRQNIDEGSTLEVSYDLKKVGMTYKTATNLAIFPKNSPADVQKCAELLKVDLNDRFVFVSNPLSSAKGPAKHPFPTPISIGDAL